VASGKLSDFSIPLWVVVACAAAMALGTYSGGWRIIHTLGSRVIKLDPIHGFAAETSAATVIQAASFMGVPVSTTHTITTAIMGVGATKRVSAVRWGVAGNIVTAWVLTLPAAALIAAAAHVLLDLIV
jgi:PiT family inorganic phosphate transporter